jgi:hypothetical protein
MAIKKKHPHMVTVMGLTPGLNYSYPLFTVLGVMEYWSDGVMKKLDNPIYGSIFLSNEYQGLKYCSD